MNEHGKQVSRVQAKKNLHGRTKEWFAEMWRPRREESKKIMKLPEARSNVLICLQSDSNRVQKERSGHVGR